jgi:predicted TIM-barrel fold metal-dependent hydrolase
MIIDTHFHAFPRKFLEQMPEAQNDVRGVGFHAFDHPEYLEVMDRHGIDVGVLSNTGGRIEKAGNRTKAVELCKILNDSFADAHARHPKRFKAFIPCTRRSSGRPTRPWRSPESFTAGSSTATPASS